MAAVVVPVVVAAVEVQVAGVEEANDAKRRRPIVPAATSAAGSRTEATARSGEEDAVAVRASDFVTRHSVLRGPSPSTLFK